jgi:hypothetical protein
MNCWGHPGDPGCSVSCLPPSPDPRQERPLPRTKMTSIRDKGELYPGQVQHNRQLLTMQQKLRDIKNMI